MHRREHVAWQDRAFVTPMEAAQIIARSPGYVRTLVVEGKLVGARISKAGPLVITVESLITLIRRAAPATVASSRPKLPAKPRLVVSNP